jgi:hypothetical protein
MRVEEALRRGVKWVYTDLTRLGLLRTHVKIVRRGGHMATHKVVKHDVCGVQPVVGPASMNYALRT